MSKFLKGVLAAVMAVASLQAPTAAFAAVPACGTPTITGTAGVGNTLTASASCSNTPTGYNYQWLAATTSAGTYSAIAGATANTLVVPTSLAGYYVKVSVSAYNASGTSATVTSSAPVTPQKFAATPFVGSATAGTADGQGSAAAFTNIASITSDANYLYVADYSDPRIRRVDAAGNVTTIAGSGTAGVVDGTGLSAQFHSPNAIAYHQQANSLIIKDASVIRELDIATGQVTTLQNRANILSVSKSGTTATVTFAKAHGLKGNVTIAGVGAPYDGTFAINVGSATSFTYTVATSGTVAAFNPVSATATGDLGYSRTDANGWWSFYESLEVAQDGRIYMTRGNLGDTNTYQYVLRFTRISGSVFSFERLFSVSGTPCAIALMSNTEMLLNACGTVNKYSTTDDWVTKTVGPAIATSQNAGMHYDPAGYLNITANQYDLAAGTSLAKFQGTAATLELWEMLGSDLYVSNSVGQSATQIYRYTGAGSGLMLQSITPPTTYTVSFDANGGSGSMAAQVSSASASLTPNAFTRTGYTFAGWNTAANGSGTPYANSASYAFATNATLYAQWTANSYSVTFDSQGGSAVSASSFTTGGSLTLPSGPTRAGFAFTGWYTASSGGASLSSPYSPGVTAAVTLYAQWAANAQAVVFDSNGGSGSMATQTGSSASALTANSYSRNGYAFAGWNTAANGSGTTFADQASYPFASSVTLYAQWSANTNFVTFDSQGGSAVASSSFSTGGSMTLPAAPTKLGYNFDGWFAAASGGSALSSPFSPAATSAITLYAQWSAVVQQNNVQQSTPASDVRYPVVTSISAPASIFGSAAVVILRGYDLHEVSAVSSSSGTASILDSSTYELVIQITGAEVGKGWVLLSNSARSLRVMDSFRIFDKASTPAVLTPKVSTFSAYFAGNTAQLAPSAKAAVRSGLLNLSEVVSVEVVGFTSSKRLTAADKRLALARANSVAAAIRSLAPSTRITVKVGPAIGVGADKRRATVTVTAAP